MKKRLVMRVAVPIYANHDVGIAMITTVEDDLNWVRRFTTTTNVTCHNVTFRVS